MRSRETTKKRGKDAEIELHNLKFYYKKVIEGT